MPRKTTRKKSIRPRRKSTISAQSVAVSIAMLEQHAEETSARFDVLGEKFDRILSRVEELALHTTSLSSRHDTQIQVLQKQLSSAEATMNDTRAEISTMSNRITDQVSKEITDAIQEMSGAIDELAERIMERHDKLDARVQHLERWRMLIIGGGIVGGVFLTRAMDILAKILVP